MYGVSLGVFTVHNKVRQALFKLVTHTHFEGFVFFVIFLSGVTLAFDDYSVQAGSTTEAVLIYSDWLISFLFLIETCLKIVAFGLVFQKKA